MYEHVFRVECDLWMEVEDLGEFPVAQFVSNWGFNEIPTATCVIGIGREALRGIEPAKIHETLSQFNKMRRVVVYFQPKGDWTKEEQWPEDAQVVFRGYIYGVGPVRSYSSVSFAIHLVHWLSDLDFSSTLSSISHPSNPAQLTYRAVLSGILKTGVEEKKSNAIMLTSAGASLGFANIMQDLWGKTLKPMFCNLAIEKHLRIAGKLLGCVELEQGKNDQALNALKLIEGVSGTSACDLSLSEYNVPLSLEGQGSTALISIAKSIGLTIGHELVDSFANQTMWGKLIGSYAPNFLFGVVPLVEKALVVPFVPGLRDTYRKRIDVGDYSHIDTPSTTHRAIRAVALYGGVEFNTGITEGKSTETLIGTGGCYMPEGANEDGMIMIARSPAWLANVPSADMSPKKSTGLATKPPDVAWPDAIDNSKKPRTDGDSRTDVITKTIDFYSQYAHAFYVVETLRGRTGTLAGKLRFDIAPGSTVEIDCIPEQFLSEVDQFGRTLVASVLKVTVGIDAEGSKAGTGFQLGYVRTMTENEDDKTSVEKHPLYSTKFLGAPLVDAYMF